MERYDYLRRQRFKPQMLIKMEKVQNILKLDKSDVAAAFANNANGRC